MYHSATSRMPFGSFRNGRGHQRDVAERGAAERGRHAEPLAASRAHGALEMMQVLFGDGPNSSRLSAGIELLFVDVRLPDDGVEEGAAQSACGRSAPPFHRPRDRSGCRRSLPSWSGNRRAPALPGRGSSTPSNCASGKAEHRLARKHADDVESHRRAQIVFHQAQHLVGLVHLHRARGQPVVVAQRGHATDVDAGYRGAAKIQRNAIRFAVVQGGAQPVPRRDVRLAQVVWLNRRFIARRQHQAGGPVFRGQCSMRRHRRA